MSDVFFRLVNCPHDEGLFYRMNIRANFHQLFLQ